MNAWEREIAATADALGRLLGTPPRPGRLDLDVAITARAAVLGCVGTVLGDIAPRTRQPLRYRRVDALVHVERDPLRVLAAILRDRPRLELSRSPSELLDASAAGRGATASWAAAGRHALLAERIWWTGAPHVLPADHAWHVVGEIAALAETIGHLDRDLTVETGRRRDVRGVLTKAGGLRLVAGEVAAVAARGQPENPAQDPAQPRGRSLPGARNRVVDPTPDLATQTRRVTTMLVTTANLTPTHIRGGVTVARDLTILAARRAAHDGDEGLQPVLAELAQHLHHAANANQGEESLRPLTHPALELALRELRRESRTALSAGHEPDPTGQLARHLSPLVDVLARQAHAQVAAGRWAMCNRSEGMTLPYTLVSTTDPSKTSDLVADLAKAASAASTVTRSLQPLASAPAGAALASLRSATSQHRHGQMRFSHPADPPSASRGLARGL